MAQDKAIVTMVDQWKVALWSIERRHFQWPWTTPNLVFEDHTILRHWISHKQVQILPQLL